jgi:ribosomal-protein-alanine N-acetyltransferase
MPPETVTTLDARCAAMRAMTVADLEAVVAIEAGAYGHPWSRASFIDSLAAGHDARVLLGDEGQVVAYSIVMDGVDERHLLNLTVERQLQRRGLGRRLLQSLVEDARRDGVAAIWLEVRASNDAALGLYRNHGFRQTGLRREYYPARAGREDAVLMTLALVETGVGTP